MNLDESIWNFLFIFLPKVRTLNFQEIFKLIYIFFNLIFWVNFRKENNLPEFLTVFYLILNFRAKYMILKIYTVFYRLLALEFLVKHQVSCLSNLEFDEKLCRQASQIHLICFLWLFLKNWSIFGKQYLKIKKNE